MLTNNLSKYLFIYPRKHCESIETSPSHVELCQKPSTFHLDINFETDNPSKTNYLSFSTPSRSANDELASD